MSVYHIKSDELQSELSLQIGRKRISTHNLLAWTANDDKILLDFGRHQSLNCSHGPLCTIKFFVTVIVWHTPRYKVKFNIWLSGDLKTDHIRLKFRYLKQVGKYLEFPMLVRRGNYLSVVSFASILGAAFSYKRYTCSNCVLKVWLYTF